MPENTPSLNQRLLDSLARRPGTWALCIIAVSLAVRLWFVASGQLNLAQDEAQYWDWSRRFQLSYYSKGPLIAWIIGFWSSIFGPTELGVRMGAIVNATLIQILLYFGVARLMGRPRLAALSLIVANTMPLFLASGILMTTDNILMVCWLGALLCLYVLTAEKGSRRPALGLLAVCMAAGTLAKYMMLAFFAVAALHLFLLQRQKLLPKGVTASIAAAMLLGAALGCLPIVIWNLQNGWVGVLHVTTLAGVTGAGTARLLRVDTALEYLGSQFGVATPWWMILMLAAGWRAARTAWSGKAPRRQKGPADAASSLSAAISAATPSAPPSTDAVRQASLLACGFWPLWLGMAAWSFHTRIYANWAGMSYVAGIVLAAAGLERLLKSSHHGERAWATRLAPLWPALGAVVFITLFGQALLTLPSRYDPTLRLKGWADMGQKLEELRNGLPNPGKVFYFSSNYDATAELAFYAPGQPDAYCADFGRRLSQYDFWPGPTDEASQGGDKTGWDAIYINAKGDVPLQLWTMFDIVEPMTYISTHRGRPGRTFAIVRLRNFNGRWPHSALARY